MFEPKHRNVLKVLNSGEERHSFGKMLPRLGKRGGNGDGKRSGGRVRRSFSVFHPGIGRVPVNILLAVRVEKMNFPRVRGAAQNPGFFECARREKHRCELVSGKNVVVRVSQTASFDAQRDRVTRTNRMRELYFKDSERLHVPAGRREFSGKRPSRIHIGKRLMNVCGRNVEVPVLHHAAGGGFNRVDRPGTIHDSDDFEALAPFDRREDFGGGRDFMFLKIKRRRHIDRQPSGGTRERRIHSCVGREFLELNLKRRGGGFLMMRQNIRVFEREIDDFKRRKNLNVGLSLALLAIKNPNAR